MKGTCNRLVGAEGTLVAASGLETEAAVLERHDFFSLERRIQDRLVAVLRREARPALLAKAALPDRRPVALVVLVALTAVAFAAGLAGLGDLASPLFRHAPWALGLYAAWLTGLGAWVVVARRRSRRARAMPLPVGRYLLASGVLEVRAESLTWARLEAAEVVGETVSCKAGGRAFTFGLVAGERDAVARELDAVASGGPSSAEASPFEPPRFGSPVAEIAARRFEPSPFERYPVPLTLVWALPLAGLLFVGREVATDARAFHTARTRDDVGTYEAYLRRGKSHVAEVRDTHLPRAALRDARAQGTVAAITRFRQAYPVTHIEPEVAAARRAAVLEELARAVHQGDLASLRAHAAAYPTEAKAERDEAIAKHVAAERERALHRLGGRDPLGLRAAIAGLHAPSAEPTVVVLEAVSEVGPGLAQAERAVQRTITFNGKRTLPSALLTQGELGSRATASSRAVRAALAPLLETDAVVVADARPSGTKEKVARLVVVRRVDWSGRVFTSLKPRVSVAGLNVAYDVSLVLPSGARPVVWRTHVSTGVHAAQIKRDPTGALEERLTREMEDEADRVLVERLERALAKKVVQASR
jgi:hypothetical protein